MNERGFTLLEIMVVVVIIGLIAALVGPGIWAKHTHATKQMALAQCQKVHGEVHTWRMIKGRFPADLSELEQPLDPEGENFTTIKDDPWDSPLRLVIEGRKVRIWSNGPDGQEGGGDDICYVPVNE